MNVSNSFVISIFIIISSTISGCNPKEKYLKEHNIILCYTSNNDEIITNEALEFEKKVKIKFKDASEIYIKFLEDKKEIKKSNHEKITYPKLIIDGNYVYSFNNLKTLDIAVFGIWINSDTGEIFHNETKLWLNERKIIETNKN